MNVSLLESTFKCQLSCFIDMRRDVQEIFKLTPHEKQVMMFSATLNKEIRPVCKKFMQDVIMKAVLLYGFGFSTHLIQIHHMPHFSF